MIALLCLILILNVLVSPFKSKSRLEAENVALRHQVVVLRRIVVQRRVRLTNTHRMFFIQLYRWFPSVLKVITVIRPETLVRWHRAGFRRYWRWKSRSLGGRPKAASGLGGWVLLLGRSAACAVCSRSNQAVRYLHNTYVYSRGVDGACARRVRGTRTARIEQSTPVKTPNDSGIGCGNPGDRRAAQGPAQIHFRGLRHAYDQCPAVAPNRDPGRRTCFTRFVDSMLGFPGRPMSRADVDRKFKSNVSKRWPQEHTDTVLQALWALDRTDDLSSVLNRVSNMIMDAKGLPS